MIASKLRAWLTAPAAAAVATLWYAALIVAIALAWGLDDGLFYYLKPR
jgi:hypothetical protein